METEHTVSKAQPLPDGNTHCVGSVPSVDHALGNKIFLHSQPPHQCHVFLERVALSIDTRATALLLPSLLFLWIVIRNIFTPSFTDTCDPINLSTNKKTQHCPCKSGTCFHHPPNDQWEKRSVTDTSHDSWSLLSEPEPQSSVSFTLHISCWWDLQSHPHTFPSSFLTSLLPSVSPAQSTDELTTLPPQLLPWCLTQQASKTLIQLIHAMHTQKNLLTLSIPSITGLMFLKESIDYITGQKCILSNPGKCVMCQTLYSSDYRKNAVLLPSLLRNARFMDNSESLYLPKRIEFICFSQTTVVSKFVSPENCMLKPNSQCWETGRGTGSWGRALVNGISALMRESWGLSPRSTVTPVIHLWLPSILHHLA